MARLKDRLEKFKQLNLDDPGHYWELSTLIFSKIPTKSHDDYFTYLYENTIVAARVQPKLQR